MHPTNHEPTEASVPRPTRATTTGVETVIPGAVVPLTWTSAGAAVEFAVRIACCSALPLLPWPRPGQEWAMCGLAEGVAVLDEHVLAEAASSAAEHPRRLSLRAARVRRDGARRGDADLAYATAVRDGRSRQVMAERTVDDLLLTSSRLLEALFRSLADHARTALAHRVSSGQVSTGADVARCLEIPRALPLWGVPATVGGVGLGSAPRAAADAAVMVAGELEATVGELGRRWVETRALDAPEDVAFLRWDELPEVAGGRMGAPWCNDRVARRRARFEEIAGAGTGGPPTR